MQNSNKTRLILSICVNIIVIALEIIGLYTYLSTNRLFILLMYTEDSNIFMLLSCILSASFSVNCLIKNKIAPPKWVKTFKYIAVCMVSLTFLVVIFVLAPMIGGIEGYKMMMLKGDMLYMHTLCPIISIIGFLMFENEPALEKKHMLYALVPTFLYAAITIVLNITHTIIGPYPFLMVYRQPIYMSVIWCIVILLAAFFVAFVIKLLNNKILNKQKLPL